MEMVSRLCAPRRRHGRRPLPDRRHAGRRRAQSGRRRRLSRRSRLMAGDAPIVLSTTALVAGYERDLPIVRGVDFAVAAGELVADPRPERRRQVDPGQGDRRAGADPFRHGRARRPRHHRRPGAREGPPRPRLRAADREHFRDAVDPRQSAACRRHPAQGEARPTHRRALRHVPRPRGDGPRDGPARCRAGSARCWRWRAR